MNQPDPNLPQDAARVMEVKRAYEDELLAKANVVGVGVGYRERGDQRTSEIALVVMVTQKLPPDQLAPDDLVPSSIEGVPVDVQEVGEITAY
jgi:hypothetical protein